MQHQASTVGLKTYFTYSDYRPPESVSIKQADFLFDDKLTLPRSGQTFLYGTRSTQRLLGRIMMQAHDQEKDICIVDVGVNVGTWVNQKHDFDTLEQLFFIKYPDRARASLMDHTNELWCQFASRQGLPVDRFPREGSLNMHLLDELIKHEPYNRANVIGFPLATKLGWVQGALVTNPEAITQVVPGTSYGTEVTLEAGPR